MWRLFTLCLLAVFAVCALAPASYAQDKARIGTEGAYPPFNYIDQEGNLKGFDVEIAKALCDAADLECEFVIQDWDGMIPGLLAQKYDAIIASMSITEERKQKVDFTDKYYQTPARFVKHKDDEVEISKQGLKDKSVGVQRATVSANFINDNFGDTVKVKPYATQEEANMDLVSGRVDLVFADAVVLLEGFLNTEDGQDYEFVGPGYTDEEWFGEGIGIAVRKQDDELRKKLNKAIQTIRENGTYQEINEKYFDFDVYGDE